jgi:hypothetical protein
MLLGGSWAHNCGEVAMLALLGDVLYWVGCGLAGFMVVAAIAVQKTPDRAIFVGGFFVGAAVLAWLAGHACRYVLAAVESSAEIVSSYCA